MPCYGLEALPARQIKEVVIPGIDGTCYRIIFSNDLQWL
jgi:hypothetical protein